MEIAAVVFLVGLKRARQTPNEFLTQNLAQQRLLANLSLDQVDTSFAARESPVNDFNLLTAGSSSGNDWLPVHAGAKRRQGLLFRRIIYRRAPDLGARFQERLEIRGGASLCPRRGLGSGR